MAKLHVRYMVGGRPSKPLQERLFSFEFPESPGALLKFLYTLGTHWNISLFHYRSHGTDYGRGWRRLSWAITNRTSKPGSTNWAMSATTRPITRRFVSSWQAKHRFWGITIAVIPRYSFSRLCFPLFFPLACFTIKM
jgi:hypothetical protein